MKRLYSVSAGDLAAVQIIKVSARRELTVLVGNMNTQKDSLSETGLTEVFKITHHQIINFE